MFEQIVELEKELQNSEAIVTHPLLETAKQLFRDYENKLKDIEEKSSENKKRNEFIKKIKPFLFLQTPQSLKQFLEIVSKVKFKISVGFLDRLLNEESNEEQEYVFKSTIKGIFDSNVMHFQDVITKLYKLIKEFFQTCCLVFEPEHILKFEYASKFFKDIDRFCVDLEKKDEALIDFTRPKVEIRDYKLRYEDEFLSLKNDADKKIYAKETIRNFIIKSLGLDEKCQQQCINAYANFISTVGGQVLVSLASEILNHHFKLQGEEFLNYQMFCSHNEKFVEWKEKDRKIICKVFASTKLVDILNGKNKQVGYIFYDGNTKLATDGERVESQKNDCLHPDLANASIIFELVYQDGKCVLKLLEASMMIFATNMVITKEPHRLLMKIEDNEIPQNGP